MLVEVIFLIVNNAAELMALRSHDPAKDGADEISAMAAKLKVK